MGVESVHLLAVNHRHGTNYWICASAEIALECLDGYIQQWWSDEIRGDPMPETADDRREQYFDRVEDESYDMERLPIIGAAGTHSFAALHDEPTKPGAD